jgi:hypothetical protein
VFSLFLMDTETAACYRQPLQYSYCLVSRCPCNHNKSTSLPSEPCNIIPNTLSLNTGLQCWSCFCGQCSLGHYDEVPAIVICVLIRGHFSIAMYHAGIFCNGEHTGTVNCYIYISCTFHRSKLCPMS